MATGMHMYFGPTTLPVNASPDSHRQRRLRTRDGFAQGSVIMTYLANATATGLPVPARSGVVGHDELRRRS